MLTRLEVSGFKNLVDVKVDFGPFTCIAGSNGIGKSNIFDAIQFLSVLATDSLVEAAQQIRGATGMRGGDPRDLFWDGYRAQSPEIRIAAEMLVPSVVEDDLGAEAEATTTFLRYELRLGYDAPVGSGSVGRLSLLGEDLTHIRRGDASRHLKFKHNAQKFRNAVVVGQRRGGAFLSTESREGGIVVNVHGDGGSFGRPQPRAVARAGRTVLSSTTTNDNPTILAARREMQQWRRLALEPSALRAPDGFSDPRTMSPDGHHLASTLHRIAQEWRGRDQRPDPEAVYARVAHRLTDLSGVKVDGLTVDVDQAREIFSIFLIERGGLRLPARALSEGTLRFLALCVLLEDPQSVGLICMEEPENGIHPANLPAIIELVKDLAVDVSMAPGPDNPLRQVIINTHSPGVVQLCGTEDLLLADVQLAPSGSGRPTRSLTLLPYKGSWRQIEGGPWFAEADVVPYLVSPPGSQLMLPIGLPR